MKEMNLAAVLIAKRREKKITQEELAMHIGVSKASVSKWENGNSYPDIAHLPVIAAYFDISIDQLINYSPQLTAAEITKTYDCLAESFVTEPFEDVIAQCEAIVKKHYSCYPLVLKISLLYINHAAMAVSAERKVQIFQLAIDLCQHLRNNCREANILQDATQYQAMCYLAIGQAEQALALVGDEKQMPNQYGIGSGAIISQAQQMLGNIEKANEVEQVELFQSLMTMFSGLLSYIRLNLAEYETAAPAYEKAESLAEMFNMRQLSPNSLAVLYILGAHMYQAAKETEKALQVLEKYVNVCVNGFFPLLVRGDSFFTKIDRWLEDEIATMPLPRNEATIKESMLNDVLLDPAFDSLRDNQEFTRLVQKLKNFIAK